MIPQQLSDRKILVAHMAAILAAGYVISGTSPKMIDLVDFAQTILTEVERVVEG